jgi:hypothetical protein
MLFSLGVLAGLAPTWAADPPAAEKPAVEKPLREQTIYVPYDKLRQVFEQHGRGVFLPYEKFQELWQAAQRATAPSAEAKPPVAAMISSADSEAVAGKDVLRVTSRLKIDILAPGWHEVALRLSDTAITTATIGGQPARILGGPEQGYRLLVEKKDKAAEQIELVLEYAKSITKTPGENQVSFEAPQAPVSRWQVRIPEPGVKVAVTPMIASAEVPQPKSDKTPGQTVVEAFVGAAPSVRIQWTARAEGAAGMEALASVETHEQVWITEGVVRTRAQLRYAISRAELAQLVVEVPADQKVAGVTDPNVRQWSVSAAGPVQRIRVQLFEPAKTTQSLSVELEKLLTGPDASSPTVPVVKAVAAGRQQGLVTVDVAQGLRAEPSRTSGLVQHDTAELPREAAGNWAFAYRYAAVPFELTFAVEKVAPLVSVDTLVETYLEPERLVLDATLAYTIERAGLFRLEVDLPAGFQVRQVQGRKSGTFEAVEVDTYHSEGAKKNRLVVELSRRALGRVALGVELARDLQEPALNVPSEQAARIPLPLPSAAGVTLQRSEGRLVVCAPESLRVNPVKEDGLRSVTFEEVFQPVVSARGSRFPTARPALAFAYAQAPTLEIAAQRRRPQVSVAQLLVARVEEGQVKYEATLFVNVRYSGVKSLRVDVPKAIGPRLRNLTPTLRDAPLQPQPKDVDEGYVAWGFTGQSELFGDARIELTWDDQEQLGQLELGKPVTLKVPCLKPREVDLAWGQIVLAKTETIDIHEADDAAGLRPIDPQHDLMPGARVAGAARAMEFRDQWSLRLVATRYALEEVKRTSIERAVVRVVVTASDQLSVQALYRIRSVRQRMELALPEGAQFDTQPLRLNSRPVALERGSPGRYFVPLVNLSPNDAFLLELRYTVPGDGHQLDLPDFPGEASDAASRPAVQRVYLCVYLPPQKLLMARHGPWGDEFGWLLNNSLRWQPWFATSDEGLVRWVSENGASPETFQTDRQAYIFSALSPPPGEPLRLVTMPEAALNSLVLAAMVVLGLLLLPARAWVRAIVLGAIVVLVVLGGLYWPIATHQILDVKLLAALLVVLAVWMVWHFTWTRWRRRPRRVSEPLPPLSVPTATPQPAEPQPAAPAEEPRREEGEGSHA